MMSAETTRQARILADLREANNPPPAHCTRSQAAQESASPDTPPVVSVQPFVRLCGDFRLLKDPMRLHFATHSSSSNVSGNPKRTLNKSRLQHWPTIMSESNQDERLANHMHSVMAWWSPRHQSRRFSASVHNRIPPLTANHVRRWLQEIYPSQFGPAVSMNELPAASLELEEVRSVFRAILARHIVPGWFESMMFAPDVTEALGLMLRNQRDRFMSDYYETLSLQYPEEESAVSFTWRYVFDHIAYDNQEHSQLGRVQYKDSYMRVEPASGEFNQVLAQLITNLPPASVPSSNEYRSYDASAYDTLRQGYLPRMHAMIPVTRHKPYMTVYCHGCTATTGFDR